MKCLIIYNPYSGRQNFIKKISYLQNKLSDFYENVDIFISDKKGSIGEKISMIKYSYDLLYVIGGDGTLNEVINAINLNDLQSFINIYYYPMGTLNDFGNSLKLKASIDESIELIKIKNIKKIQVIKANNCFFTYASAFGKYTDISYDISSKSKKRLKYFAYYLQIIKSLHKKYSLSYDSFSDKSENINNYVTFFLNSYRVGGFNLHFKDKFFYDSQKIRMVVIKKCPFCFWHLINFFIFGGRYKSKNVTFKDVSNVKICSSDYISLNGDGELLLEDKNIELSVNENNYIRIYVPLKMNKFFKQ